MKILFISALLPYPLYSGGQVRLYNLLKILSRQHDITLISYIRNLKEQEELRKLDFLKSVKVFMRGRRWRPHYIIRSLFTGSSWLSSSYLINDMKDYIQKSAENSGFDLVHIEPFYTFPVVSGLGLPLVVCEHNIEYEIYERFAGTFGLTPLNFFIRKEAGRIKKEEINILSQASEIIAVSREDADKIQKISSEKEINIVPNGVDTSWFTYKQKEFGKSITYLFTGNFNWLPNREACDKLFYKIWPQIEKSTVNSRLIIAGQNIPKSYDIQQKRIQILSDSRDIREVFDKADVLLAPMTISGGSKFKILEAIASGVLVVTTSQGAQGLEIVEGKHYLKAISDSDFVKRALEIKNSGEKIFQITQNARKLIEDKYSWEKIARIQDEVWKKYL